MPPCRRFVPSLGYVPVARKVNAALAAVLIWAALVLPAPARAAETIVVFGDSLTAGYGLRADDAFPARLQAALKDKGHDVTVRNAGVSGDTSAGGLARLDWTLAEKPDAMILELGANDGLRGLDPQATFRNLDAIIAKAKAAGVPVLLAGMLAPPNLGREYAREFDGIYPVLARKHDILFYHFFLAGVAARPELNQKDGIHPNAKGVAVIVERILPSVLDLLARAGKTAGKS